MARCLEIVNGEECGNRIDVEIDHLQDIGDNVTGECARCGYYGRTGESKGRIVSRLV